MVFTYQGKAIEEKDGDDDDDDEEEWRREKRDRERWKAKDATSN